MAKSILYPSKSVDLISAFLIALFLLLGILSSSVYAIPVESADKRYLDNDDGTITDMALEVQRHVGWAIWKELQKQTSKAEACEKSR